METNTLKDKMSIPGAILLAGGLIAVAILFSRMPATPTTSTTTGTTPTDVSISLREITAQDHILGSLDAPVTIVEYSDTECPFCKQYHNTLHTLLSESKNQSLAWVYRHFPIPQLHSKAQREAQALECAAELGGNDDFWQYTDELYRITPSNDGLDLAELPRIAARSGINVVAFNNCLDSGKYAEKVEKDRTEAVSNGGRGTPFSIVVLKKSLSKEGASKISSIALELKNQTRDDIILISSDKKKILLNGALPIDLLREIILGSAL